MLGHKARLHALTKVEILENTLYGYSGVTLEFSNKKIRGSQPGISQFIKLGEENKLQEGRL